MNKKINKAVLVYQAGIANVFSVECFNVCNFGRDAKRLIQSDFRTCESFARGLAHAGVLVCTMQCNKAGDIIESEWSVNLTDAPFSDKFHPVFNGVLPDDEKYQDLYLSSPNHYI